MINTDEIKINENNLIKFKGYIPFYFLNYIDFGKRNYFLIKNELWDVINETFDVREKLFLLNDNDKYEYMMREIEDFVKENEKFSSIII